MSDLSKKWQSSSFSRMEHCVYLKAPIRCQISSYVNLKKLTDWHPDGSVSFASAPWLESHPLCKADYCIRVSLPVLSWTPKGISILLTSNGLLSQTHRSCPRYLSCSDTPVKRRPWIYDIPPSSRSKEHRAPSYKFRTRVLLAFFPLKPSASVEKASGLPFFLQNFPLP